MNPQPIQILHRERIPDTGVLVIPGRLDACHLSELEKVFAGRRITWLVEEQSDLDPAVRRHLESCNSGAMFTQRDRAPQAAGEQLKSSLTDGGVLIHVPGRAAVRNATPCHIPTPHLRTLCAFGLPVIAVAIDTPSDSCLSIEEPTDLPSAVIAFSQPMAALDCSVPRFREALLEAAESAFATRKLLQGSLGMALVAGLKRHGSTCRIIDGADDSVLRYDRIFAAALAFSRVIRRETDQPRVAIVLPPGKAGLVANLAVIFAGKIPVNLNFTAGPDAIRSCIRQSEVDRFITADPFVRKFPSFPWPANRDLILIERTLPAIKRKIILWAVVSKLLPAARLGRMLGLHRHRGDDEATLLFTSGSSGEPKGVVLTHRNLLANVTQFATRLQLPPGSSLLGSLPLFHSFGCTVTLWYPCIEGVNLVTYPSPLESKRLAELIALHQVDLLLSTPTFLRGFMKRAEPVQLASLKLVVTGAEKLPRNLATAFAERFGIHPQEGYGLTETSPATHVNLPDPEATGTEPVIASSRDGSVGQFLPGMAVRITHPETDAPLPPDQQGIIWIKGANVFPGYLGQPEKSAEVIRDGWFKTGDVGRLDEDGFLFIEGRMSRFSKIGGEMVPHETIEAAVNKVLGLDGEGERRIAVLGVPDPQKGESIVLLSAMPETELDQQCIELRYRLLDEGIPSLWCPKRIIPVPQIPVLASGKLDLRACEALLKRNG